jgi:putative membrane protein
MTLEALLAYAHLLAILTMVVFLASEAALCRAEWLNAAVVQRLARVDMIYGLLVVIAALSLGPTRMFIRWRRTLDAGGGLPSPDEVRRARRLVMWQAHLLALVPLAGVVMARGFGA